MESIGTESPNAPWAMTAAGVVGESAIMYKNDFGEYRNRLWMWSTIHCITGRDTQLKPIMEK